MRVVSMVPSWTETLIEAGVEVVGRTRFCIHPADKVKTIPVVGGTKDLDSEMLKSLKFDYLILDKEENRKEMFEEAGECEILVTHVQSCADVSTELKVLASKLKNKKLAEYASRWSAAIKAQSERNLSEVSHMNDQPSEKLGIIDWIRKPTGPIAKVVYVIWKNPYMAVTQETFVGSMLEIVGLATDLSEVEFGKKYPEIKIENFDSAKTLFLFSSEPFPFHKKRKDIESLDILSAIVDGEKFSWFGVRSLEFLEDYLR